MINKLIQELREDNWFGGPFEMELLEFTRANRIEKERAIQKARSRGKDQKGVDKERKSTERGQAKREESANPWKNVVIVKTVQDGKTRLIPRSDFEPGRHELLYGTVSGQPPKPEVTPNVAREISQQDGFEPSKTSNRLLGVQQKKKRGKEEVVRSDHYDYPKDGVQRVDPTSTYPDWDHAVDTMAQGISRVGVMKGTHTVDMGTVVIPIIIELMKTIGDMNDVGYIVEDEDFEQATEIDEDTARSVLKEAVATVKEAPAVKQGGLMAKE